MYDFSLISGHSHRRAWRTLKEAVMSEIETVGVILTIAVVLMLVWSRYKLT